MAVCRRVKNVIFLFIFVEFSLLNTSHGKLCKNNNCIDEISVGDLIESEDGLQIGVGEQVRIVGKSDDGKICHVINKDGSVGRILATKISITRTEVEDRDLVHVPNVQEVGQDKTEHNENSEANLATEKHDGKSSQEPPEANDSRPEVAVDELSVDATLHATPKNSAVEIAQEHTDGGETSNTTKEVTSGDGEVVDLLDEKQIGNSHDDEATNADMVEAPAEKKKEDALSLAMKSITTFFTDSVDSMTKASVQNTDTDKQKGDDGSDIARDSDKVESTADGNVSSSVGDNESETSLDGSTDDNVNTGSSDKYPNNKFPLKPLSDPVPKFNVVVQSEPFAEMRRKMIRSYITSNFADTDMDSEMQEMIDDLVSSDLLNDLRDFTNGIYESLTKQAKLNIDTPADANITEQAVDVSKETAQNKTGEVKGEDTIVGDTTEGDFPHENVIVDERERKRQEYLREMEEEKKIIEEAQAMQRDANQREEQEKEEAKKREEEKAKQEGDAKKDEGETGEEKRDGDEELSVHEKRAKQEEDARRVVAENIRKEQELKSEELRKENESKEKELRENREKEEAVKKDEERRREEQERKDKEEKLKMDEEFDQLQIKLKEKEEADRKEEEKLKIERDRKVQEEHRRISEVREKQLKEQFEKEELARKAEEERQQQQKLEDARKEEQERKVAEERQRKAEEDKLKELKEKEDAVRKEQDRKIAEEQDRIRAKEQQRKLEEEREKELREKEEAARKEQARKQAAEEHRKLEEEKQKELKEKEEAARNEQDRKNAEEQQRQIQERENKLREKEEAARKEQARKQAEEEHRKLEEDKQRELKLKEEAAWNEQERLKSAQRQKEKEEHQHRVEENKRRLEHEELLKQNQTKEAKEPQGNLEKETAVHTEHATQETKGQVDEGSAVDRQPKPEQHDNGQTHVNPDNQVELEAKKFQEEFLATQEAERQKNMREFAQKQEEEMRTKMEEFHRKQEQSKLEAAARQREAEEQKRQDELTRQREEVRRRDEEARRSEEAERKRREDYQNRQAEEMLKQQQAEADRKKDEEAQQKRYLETQQHELGKLKQFNEQQRQQSTFVPSEPSVKPPTYSAHRPIAPSFGNAMKKVINAKKNDVEFRDISNAGLQADADIKLSVEHSASVRLDQDDKHAAHNLPGDAKSNESVDLEHEKLKYTQEFDQPEIKRGEELSATDKGCAEPNTKFNEHDITTNESVPNLKATNWRECQRLCVGAVECRFWTHSEEDGDCWLKLSDVGRTEVVGFVSGPRVCPMSPPVTGSTDSKTILQRQRDLLRKKRQLHQMHASRPTESLLPKSSPHVYNSEDSSDQNALLGAFFDLAENASSSETANNYSAIDQAENKSKVAAPFSDLNNTETVPIQSSDGLPNNTLMENQTNEKRKLMDKPVPESEGTGVGTYISSITLCTNAWIILCIEYFGYVMKIITQAISIPVISLGAAFGKQERAAGATAWLASIPPVQYAVFFSLLLSNTALLVLMVCSPARRGPGEKQRCTTQTGTDGEVVKKVKMQLQSARTELETCLTTNADLNTTVEDFREKVDESTVHLDEISTSCANWKSRAESFEIKHTDSLKCNAELEDSIAQFEGTITQLEREKADLKYKEGKLNEEITELREAKEQKEQHIFFIVKELDVKDSKLEEMNEEVQRKDEDINKLREELNLNEKKREDLMDEYELSQTRLNESMDVTSCKLDDINKLNDEIEELRNIIVSLETENKSESSESNGELSENGEPFQKVDLDEQRENEERSKEERLERLLDVTKMRMNTSRVQSELDLVSNELDAKRSKLEQLETSNIQLQSSVDSLSYEVKKFHSLSDELRIQKDTLAKFFHDREQALQKSVAESQAECLQLKTTLDKSGLAVKLNVDLEKRISDMELDFERERSDFRSKVNDAENEKHNSYMKEKQAVRDKELILREKEVMRKRLSEMSLTSGGKNSPVQAALTPARPPSDNAGKGGSVGSNKSLDGESGESVPSPPPSSGPPLPSLGPRPPPFMRPPFGGAYGPPPPLGGMQASPFGGPFGPRLPYGPPPPAMMGGPPLAVNLNGPTGPSSKQSTPNRQQSSESAQKVTSTPVLGGTPARGTAGPPSSGGSGGSLPGVRPPFSNFTTPVNSPMNPAGGMMGGMRGPPARPLMNPYGPPPAGMYGPPPAGMYGPPPPNMMQRLPPHGLMQRPPPPVPLQRPPAKLS